MHRRDNLAILAEVINKRKLELLTKIPKNQMETKAGFILSPSPCFIYCRKAEAESI